MPRQSNRVVAKKTSKNRITLPKAVADRFAGIEYFDVSTDGKTILLRPVRQSHADEVRAKLAELGIDEQDVVDAVDWARKTA